MLLAISVIFSAVTLLADDSTRYFPMAVGNTWYYKTYKREEPDKIYKSKTIIVNKEKVDVREYFDFRADVFDVNYLMRKDGNGVYTRLIRFPFLVFSITVDVIPEMQTLAFPLAKGKKWSYKGKAKTVVLGFINIEREIKAEFEVMCKETIHTEAGEKEAFHVQAIINMGDDKPKLKKYWYAKDVGFAISDNDNHVLKITGYELFPEKDDEKRVNIPAGAEEYR